MIEWVAIGWSATAAHGIDTHRSSVLRCSSIAVPNRSPFVLDEEPIMSVRFWQDIPPHERIDEGLLCNRVGSTDPAWLRRHLQRLYRPGCVVAVRWLGESLYVPCGNGLGTPQGLPLCHAHLKYSEEFLRRSGSDWRLTAPSSDPPQLPQTTTRSRYWTVVLNAISSWSHWIHQQMTRCHRG